MNAQVEKFIGLVSRCRVGMLGTYDDVEGRMLFRPMSHVDIDDGGNLWFFTGATTQKAIDVKSHPEVQVLYCCETEGTYLSITGTAHLDTNRTKMKELFNPFVKAWFPKGLDEPGIALLVVQPHDIDYWTQNESKTLTYAKMLATAVSDSTPSVGERGKLEV